jgi:leucyl-tRNA synthetase
MVCVNELTDIKCHKKQILEPFLILLSPYAPHIAEELYQLLYISSPPGERLGEGGASIHNATFPAFDPKHLVESSKEYPVSVNGKMRTTINIQLDAAQEEVEKLVLSNKIVQKWMLAGLIVIAIGFILMVGGKSSDPNVFLETEVYSARRITIAPVLIIVGLLIEIFAIMRKPQ